jgi:hypothetical protein
MMMPRSHARWVKHCLEETHDYDYLPGDVRVAMLTLANNVIAYAPPAEGDEIEHAARERWPELMAARDELPPAEGDDGRGA